MGPLRNRGSVDPVHGGVPWTGTRQIASWYSQKICKQSLWLDYKKKGSTNPVAQTIWLASFLLIVQSESFVYKSFVNFNLQFVLVTCKLLRAISLSKLQYCGTILQCCLQENIQFDCNNSSAFIGREPWSIRG
jgi:hypothetical protein